MPIVDIVVAVIALIALIIGICRGTFKSFLKLFSMALALFITLLMANTVATFILNTPLMTELVLGNSVSLKALYGETLAAWKDSTLLNAMYAPMVEKLTALGGATFGGAAATVEQMLPAAMAFQSGIIAGCFMLYIVFRIIIMIIAFIIKRLVGRNRVGGFSRFIGMLIGIVNGVVITSIIFVLATVVIPMGPITKAATPFTDTSYFVQYSTPITQKAVTNFAVSNDNLKLALEYAGYTFS